MRDIRPYEGESDPDYRFSWNTPVHLSRNEPGRIYLGAQFLFRSDDRGESWETISPDLTTDDPEKQRQEESGGLSIDNSTAENHCTIYSISESPKDGNVLWVGTDDGNLQVTRDGGKLWTNVVGNVPDVPPHTWVTSVHAGPHAPGTAFVTFDGHRTGDLQPYVFRTDDYGQSWTSLVTDALEGYALVIRQDLENPDLVFLGTEFGLYITLDRGQNWARFKGNLPKVGVRDLTIHPREGDLILGTHGRGIYILDDITPLRALTRETLEKEVSLLPSRPAVMTIPASVQDFGGADEFSGRNPFQAAVISYYLEKRHIFGDLKLEVYDGDGTLLKTIPGGKRKGMNRVYWATRLKPPKVPPANQLVPAFQGPRVKDGEYTVKLIKGKTTVSSTFQVVADPRSPHSAEERGFQQQTAMQLYGMLEQMTYVIDSLIDLRDQAKESGAGLDESAKLRRRLESYSDELEEFRKSIVASSEAGRLSGEEQLREKLGGLYGNVVRYDGRPTRSQLERIEVLGERLEVAKRRFDELKKKAEELNLEPLSPEAWEAKTEENG
jgi:hypothetical protein